MSEKDLLDIEREYGICSDDERVFIRNRGRHDYFIARWQITNNVCGWADSRNIAHSDPRFLRERERQIAEYFNNELVKEGLKVPRKNYWDKLKGEMRKAWHFWTGTYDWKANSVMPSYKAATSSLVVGAHDNKSKS